nr:hypothetical protein [Bradyrhizobium valentinum]
MNNQVTRINTIIDAMPRDGIFGLLGQQRPRRRMSSRIPWQRTVVVVESPSTHSPKHICWQHERIGNRKYPVHRFGIEQYGELFNAPYAQDIGASSPIAEYGVGTQDCADDVAHLHR